MTLNEAGRRWITIDRMRKWEQATTIASLTGFLERILALAERAAPQAVDALRLSIGAYRHHLD